MPIAQDQVADFPSLRSARQLWASGSLDAALDRFERALAERPTNLKCLLEAARAFGGRHEIARAEALLERADALAEGDARVAPMIAQSYARMFRPHRAIELLSATPSLPAPLLGELATLHEQVGRLDDALSTIDACIRLAPSAPEPGLVRARVLRRMGRDEQAATILHTLVGGDHKPMLLAEAWTELCYVRDRMGDYEGAVEAIDHAHELMLQRPGARQLLERAKANNRALGALSRELDRATLDAWADPPPPRDGRVRGVGHLIGFPRSGTTLLEQALAAHPGLAASPERVVFCRDVFPRLCRAGGGPLTLGTLNAIPGAVIERERSRYLDYMEAALGEPLGGRVHLDKNPNHTSLLPGLVRLFPESRFVVALRDPRDVVVSCFLRSFQLTEFSAMLLSWESACEIYAFEMCTWLRYREVLDASDWVEVS